MIQTAINILKQYYNVETILDSKVLLGGYCNQSFVISALINSRQGKYLVRRYNPKTEKKELIFRFSINKITIICDF